MAISEDKVAAAPAAPRENRAAPPSQEGRWGFHDGGFFTPPIPRGIGSEYYTNLKERLQEIYKNTTPKAEVTVVDLSRATHPALDFSCLLVCTRLKDAASLGVAVHILLLSETGSDIPPLVEHYQDRRVTVYRVPSDAINDVLVSLARQVVQQAYNLPRPNDVVFVDGTVVGARFDPKNKDSVWALALNSAVAGVNELQLRKSGAVDLNLARLNESGQSSIEVYFQRQQLENIVQDVFRSDITIAFTNSRGGDKDGRVLNTGDRSVTFSKVHSYMDVVWCPISDQNPLGAVFMPQQAAVTQKFAARQIITAIEAGYAQTVSATLLAISTALALRNPSMWIQGFRPIVTNRKELDLTDIGALNIEGNLPVRQPSGITAPNPSGFGDPVDTKSDEFRMEQLGLYVSALFHKEPMLAIDVPEFGPSTHFLNVFAAAAHGHTGAIDRILHAANELTNGEFEKHFGRQHQLFATTSERIHAGTWVDTNGITHDLRDFDYVAVANICHSTRNPQGIRDYSDTFLRTEYPEIQRLEARRKMLMHFSQDTAKFTGYYQRLTFHKDFLQALDRGIAAMNMRVNFITPRSAGEIYNHRGTATYAQSAMLGNNPSYIQSGLYNNSRGPVSSFAQYRF